MSIVTVGQVEISKFVITSGGKKGLWTRATARNVQVCTEDPTYHQQIGSTSFIAVNPQGKWVNWDDLPVGSQYFKCTKFQGSKFVECSPELIQELVYGEPKAEKEFLHLVKNTDVTLNKPNYF